MPADRRPMGILLSVGLNGTWTGGSLQIRRTRSSQDIAWEGAPFADTSPI
ncbi:hypothetical protein GGD46_000031 [Rhizobium lusitanum]|uniref:Uncharacterized protein n=1 Tax=Rhizobium lusitanum TaxID=293958 RepID=A0A7X0ILN6_9HYPH|nr:hypothetical protein [Rhizobium lusitanum]